MCAEWSGVERAFHNDPRQHFSISGFMANLWWKTVWLAVVWWLWIHRNAVIFKEENPELDKVVELIKVRSWMRLSSKAKGFLAKWINWAMQPLLCLTKWLFYFELTCLYESMNSFGHALGRYTTTEYFMC